MVRKCILMVTAVTHMTLKATLPISSIVWRLTIMIRALLWTLFQPSEAPRLLVQTTLNSAIMRCGVVTIICGTIVRLYRITVVIMARIPLIQSLQLIYTVAMAMVVSSIRAVRCLVMLLSSHSVVHVLSWVVTTCCLQSTSLMMLEKCLTSCKSQSFTIMTSLLPTKTTCEMTMLKPLLIWQWMVLTWLHGICLILNQVSQMLQIRRLDQSLIVWIPTVLRKEPWLQSSYLIIVTCQETTSMFVIWRRQCQNLMSCLIRR